MERENLENFGLGGVADEMARAKAGSQEDQVAKAEFQRRQTDFQERQAKAAERAADAAENAAKATVRAADSAERNTKYTLWLLIASVITALTAVVSVFLNWLLYRPQP